MGAVPSLNHPPIVTFVTLQGWQNALQKSRPVRIGQYRYCVHE